MRYDAYDPLVSPARPTASLQRLAMGVVLTVFAYIMLSQLMWSVLPALMSHDAFTALLGDLQTARAPATVLVHLFSFGLLIAALKVTLHLVHQRSLLGLLGPLPRLLLQSQLVCAALVMLFAITMVLPLPEALSPSTHTPFDTWILVLPVALLGLLIQTSAEELVFRGYLQSQMAARFDHPAIWIGVPSALFALLHYDPDLPGINAMIIVIWAAAFGAVAADLTARSGTLGPAIALHMINNISAVLIAAPLGQFDGLALYTYPFSLAASDALLVWAPVDLMVLLCCWLAARLALRR